MGYKKCLEAAGAEVLEYQEFGSWQGDWWAKVNYQGRTGWVHGYFGSCSGCDAFEAEFFWCDGHYINEDSDNEEYHNYYDLKDGCSKCEELKLKMVEFGKNYLDGIMSQEEAEKIASEDIEWDFEAKDMLEFIKRKK